MESCHPQQAGLSVCTVSALPLVVDTPVRLPLVSESVCRGGMPVCARVSLPQPEMTLGEAAILPETVNIIQYQATGINSARLLLLLLAEMCCCFSLSARQRFFPSVFLGPDLFPIRDVPDDG